MNDDSFAGGGRRIARTNGRVFGTRRAGRKTIERVASLAARWLVYLAVGLAVAWAIAPMVVPALDGMVVATVAGLGLFLILPFAAIAGIVRVIERIE